MEFVIMSGPEVYDYLLAIRAQLRAHLSAAFPEIRFSLVSHEAEGMGFIVVPVVGTLGGDGDADWAEPDYVLIGEIRRALEAFKPQAATLH